MITLWINDILHSIRYSLQWKRNNLLVHLVITLLRRSTNYIQLNFFLVEFFSANSFLASKRKKSFRQGFVSCGFERNKKKFFLAKHHY